MWQCVRAVRNTLRYFRLRTDGGTYKEKQLSFKGAGELLTPDSFLFPIDDGKGGLRPLSYEDLTTALQNDLQAAGYVTYVDMCKERMTIKLQRRQLGAPALVGIGKTRYVEGHLKYTYRPVF